MGRSEENERMVLDTKFGKLVCEVMSDGDYKEFAIDLVRPDGRAYQVAVVGTNEHSDDPHYNDDMVHVYTWDGQYEDCAEQFYMDPNGEGWYAKEER